MSFFSNLGLCPIRRAKEEPSRPKPRSNHEEKDAAVAKVPLRKERSDFFSFLREEGTDRRAGEGAVAHGGDRNQGEMDKGGNQTLMMEVRLNKRMSELGLCSRVPHTRSLCCPLRLSICLINACLLQSVHNTISLIQREADVYIERGDVMVCVWGELGR